MKYAIYDSTTHAFARESTIDAVSGSEFAVDVTPLGIPDGWLIWSSFDPAAKRMTFTPHHLVFVDRTTNRVMSQVVSDFPVAETADRYCVDVTGQGLAMEALSSQVYHPTTGVFTATQAQAATRMITVDRFFTLFTQAERITMRQRASGAGGATRDDNIADLLQNVEFRVGTGIDLLSSRTVAGLGYLVSAGVLSAGRAQQIMSNIDPT
jgi:hypothetical protein